MSMRRISSLHSGRTYGDRRWKIPFFISLLVSITLFMVTVFCFYSSSDAGDELEVDIVSFAKQEDCSGYFIESDLRRSLGSNGDHGLEPPKFAYLIYGTKGDSQRILRTLQAVYHPRN